MALVSEEIKQRIEKLTKGLSGKSLDEIAKENGIFYADANLFEIAEWVSWCIIYNQKDNRFSILIEQSDHPNRKRFTFAHELGHFFLHKDKLKWDHKIFIDTDNNYSLFRRNSVHVRDEDKPLEAEANYFAAELLMPKDVVEKAYNEIWSIEILSNVFRVSIEAMTYRLSNLGLLQNNDVK